MPLYNVHTHEYLRLRVYDRRGRLRPQALRAFSAFVRSHRTGEWIPIHWRVLVLLYDLFLHFGQPQVSIYSGYRPNHDPKAKKSKHATGHAVDFALDGVENRDVVSYLLRHQYHMGVGFYPNSYHVHLDVRPKNAFWVDYSGPGEAAVYSRSSREDFWSGRARRGYVPLYAKRSERTRNEGDETRAAPDGGGGHDSDAVNRPKGMARPPARPRRRDGLDLRPVELP